MDACYHSHMDNAYDQGFQAYQNGESIDSNPYQDDTDDFYDWEGGWVAASDAEDE